jgi:ketosteroid isomerase-like protein
MKRWAALCVTLLAMCLFSGTGRADDAERDRAVELIERWLAAQNSGDFAAYSTLYADDFRGTRRSGKRTVELDRVGWMKERARMFQKPMRVDAISIEVYELGAGTMRANFLQSWASGRYHDAGRKSMTIATHDGALWITGEELKNSSVLSRPITPSCNPGCTHIAPPASQRREVKACETACAESADTCVHYAQVIQGGLCGVKADIARAIGIVEEACKRPEALACEEAARLLKERNAEGDLSRAIELLGPRCNDRDCSPESLLPVLLFARREKPDLERAFRIERGICSRYLDSDRKWDGSASPACETTARMLETGQGTPRSAKRAREVRESVEALEREESPSQRCCVEDQDPN